ncbi:TonB-dependent receptor [Dyadobacter sp. Leaf189]|uniref:SusC/RagA family TonB-linked outer membrane protein n=1 Tax=Dyadobacter sp. Leaf189 TaxID=1736295 RepID=UPI0006F8A019|nr:TonB-dependent receptor [Dyadobacter sp. Leaf189]KQS30834.1 hypothetical protein ASG33_10685 [Dyadobacter sp. Leaf189]
MYKNFINRGRHALSALQPAIKSIMRIGLLYLIITVTCAQLLLANSSGAQSLAEIQVSVELRNEEVRSLLKQIEKQTALRFAYMENQLSRKEKFNLPKGRYRVSEALNVTLPALNLAYMNTGNVVYIVRKQPDQREGKSPQAGISEHTGVAPAAPVQLTVKGKVADEKGEGLPGVNIILKGTQQGQISDVNGRFSIEVPDEDAVLVFSFVGYIPQEVAVGKKTDIEVLLKVDQKALDEVVVVGYGTQQRKNISGSIATAPTELVANRPVMNVGQALQGTVANLSVNVGNGRADTSPSYNIRGQNSINGTDGPMVVIDGIIMDAAALNNLNPQDIENVSVLKDAASAAIYGSRAAFGVILVKTKSGRTEKPQISYNNNFVIKQPTYRPQIVEDPYTNFWYSNQMGAFQFGAHVLEYAQRLQNDPSLPKFMEFGGSWTYFESTNWYDQIFRKQAFSTQHGIEISGKTDRVNYLLSGNFQHEDGLLKPVGEDFNRYNIRSKLDFRVTDWWTIGNNTSFMRNSYSRPSAFNDAFLFYSQTMGSYEAVRNPEGGWSSAGVQSVGKMIDGGQAETTNNLFQSSLNTKISLLKDVLDLQGNFAYTNNMTLNQWGNFSVPYKRGPSLPFISGGNNAAARGTTPRTQIYMDAYANFTKTFAQKHFVNVMAGYSQESYRNQYLYYDRVGLVTPTFPTPQLATGTISLQESVTKWAMRSGFARLNYIFDNKYIMEMNGRYDGSSRFPKGKRFVFNPSASVAWVLSNESFMEFLTPVASHLKVRASYGQLANQASSVFGYMPTMGFSRLNAMLDGTRPMTVGAPGLVAGDYTWERVITRNLGLDMNFLRDRLSFSGDLFIRDTKDMLTKAKTYPGTLGAAAPNVNAADLQTRGWEVNLGWRDRFKLGKDDFRYNFNLILSDNRAKITRYDNATGTLDDHYVGKRIGEIWGLTTLGYFGSNDEVKTHADQSQVSSNAYPLEAGDLKFADLNGDGKVNRGQWTLNDHGDYSIIGNSEPRYAFGLNLRGEWKGFDVGAFFQGVGRRNFYPTYRSTTTDYEFYSYYATQWTHLTPHMRDNHWTPERTDTFYPRLKPGIAETPGREMAVEQTRYLQNAAYLRLKNLSIGYTLPANATKAIRLSRVRVFASGDNLFTWSKLPKFYQVDPELAGRASNGGGIAYSLQRVFSCGLNVTF